MFTFVENTNKTRSNVMEMFNFGDKKYINSAEESEDTDDEKPKKRKKRFFFKKFDFKKRSGYANYKDFFRNNYPNFEIKEINEELTYFQKIISSKYFYYIIIYKLVSWTLKGMFLLYMFFNGVKKDKKEEKGKENAENKENEDKKEKKKIIDEKEKKLKKEIKENIIKNQELRFKLIEQDLLFLEEKRKKIKRKKKLNKKKAKMLLKKEQKLKNENVVTKKNKKENEKINVMKPESNSNIIKLDFSTKKGTKTKYNDSSTKNSSNPENK